MSSKPKNTCPSCQQIDGVQKVSAIVDAGKQTATNRGSGWVGLESTSWSSTTTSSTDLAEKLAIASPQRMGGFLQIVVVIVFLVAWYFVFMSAVDALPTPMTTEEAAEVNPLVQIFVPLYGLCFVPLLLAGFVIFRRRAYKAKVTEWQSRKNIWNRLYYCHRCDNVYAPGLKRTVPPAHTEAFVEDLNEQYGSGAKKAKTKPTTT